ncbi:DUF554 domain-containing protein [Desulfoferrobacter suflitae]|uniref:DUF554 domain-containing protein n=1 Tax=Desulfoferrobacter suflitae TaxID=2865782 RepID=UPI002164478D|nr:DUF554 domain-containing protein [Desulfoferrobacter suflitae]MCK8602779.1 DUF554 domain-containing protein [Desulfoferrobacter suflitae]
MTGTLINVAAILLGSSLGLLAGSRLSENLRNTVTDGLGLVTSLIGLQMALQTENVLVLLAAMLCGGLIGELLHISEGIEKLGCFLQSRLSKGGPSRFSEAFITATLVFCIGPMAILGSIQDGLSGDYSLLTVKSMLDGFASVAFSATLGWGVSFSAVSILIYQGGITLFAGLFDRVLTQPMIVEMTATGGLIIVGIGLKLLKVKEIRLANFLPALAIAPLIVLLIPVVRSLR